MPRPSLKYQQSKVTEKVEPKDPPKPKRKERLAVNLFDLDHIPKDIRSLLLAGKLDLKTPIWVDKDRLDETAVEFSCDLVTAACCCDVLRQNKVNGNPVRVYLCRSTAWQRIPNGTLLSVMRDGKPELNPELFSFEVNATDIVPLPVSVVEW